MYIIENFVTLVDIYAIANDNIKIIISKVIFFGFTIL